MGNWIMSGMNSGTEWSGSPTEGGGNEMGVSNLIPHYCIYMIKEI